MERKKDKLLKFIKEKSYKQALIIAKKFYLDFNKIEQRTLQIASESLSGYGKIYEQIGINTNEEVNKAKVILDNYLLQCLNRTVKI